MNVSQSLSRIPTTASRCKQGAHIEPVVPRDRPCLLILSPSLLPLSNNVVRLMRWIGRSTTPIACALLAFFQGLVPETRAESLAELLALHLPSLLRSSKEAMSNLEVRDDEPYWLETIAHRGTAAYNSNPSYQVFRNVKVRLGCSCSGQCKLSGSGL